MGLTLPTRLAVLLAAMLSAGVPATAEPGTGRLELPGPELPRLELLGLRGFDPVSYFLDAGPQSGSDRFELSWGGRVWRFASGANRAAFAEDPVVYAPRLSGYDAAGVLDGRVVDADPAVFAVIGERLYLFRDAERRARFLADPSLARTAEARWPTLRGLLDDPGE